MPSVIASLVALAASGAVNSAQAANIPASAAAALPSGSSAKFRERMIDWSAAPAAVPLRARNQPRELPAARLDRLAISSRFGWRRDPITGVGRLHAGIDFPIRFGSPVMATAPGMVRVAGWVGGYGNLVEIEHAGGVRTRYGHLSRIDVVPSQHVEEGQVIGEVGSTGHSTGPHLHYEVRLAGSAVDPLTFVGQRAPAFDTLWGSELRTTPRWAWWNGSLGKALPEVSLR